MYEVCKTVGRNVMCFGTGLLCGIPCAVINATVGKGHRFVKGSAFFAATTLGWAAADAAWDKFEAEILDPIHDIYVDWRDEKAAGEE